MERSGSDTGRWSPPDGPLGAAAHRLLLLRMTLAPSIGDRRYADHLLVQATRWLKHHPEDPVILEARDLLREHFPPAH